MSIYCTLFDSHYLIRGLALYESLKKNCSDFHLYIFPFDDIALEVLKKLRLPSVTLIPLYEWEDPSMLEVKNTVLQWSIAGLPLPQYSFISWKSISRIAAPTLIRTCISFLPLIVYSMK